MANDTEAALAQVEQELATEEKTIGHLARVADFLVNLVKGKHAEPDGDEIDGKEPEGDANPDADEDEGDEDEDEEMDKGVCPHCKHKGVASDFGIMAKGSPAEMVWEVDASTFAPALGPIYEQIDEMRKGFSDNQGSIANVLLGLTEATASLREEIAELRAGQDTLAKGITTRATDEHEPTPMDRLAARVAGDAAAAKSAPDEGLNKGEGAPVFLTADEEQRALSKRLLTATTFVDYKAGRMPPARVADIKRQVAATN